LRDVIPYVLAHGASEKDGHAGFTLFELGGSNNPGALKTLYAFATMMTALSGRALCLR
jgi:hypothetical protein